MEYILAAAVLIGFGNFVYRKIKTRNAAGGAIVGGGGRRSNIQKH